MEQSDSDLLHALSDRRLKMNEITCEIKEHIGVLSENPKTGWKTEANIVSWNGGADKLDIRSWSPDHERRHKGITLKLVEAEALESALTKYFGQK